MNSPKFSRLTPEQRREQILDAANALFAERPYDEVAVEDIARAAGVTRGLVHHYFGGRKDVYIGLLERLGAQRENELRPPEGRNAGARVADTVSRWLDWTEANRAVYLATIGRGADIADPDVRHVVSDLVAAPSRCSQPSTPTSPPTHRDCATHWSAGPGSTAPRPGAGSRRRHPRHHTRAARLHTRTRPTHLRRTLTPRRRRPPS